LCGSSRSRLGGGFRQGVGALWLYEVERGTWLGCRCMRLDLELSRCVSSLLYFHNRYRTYLYTGSSSQSQTPQTQPGRSSSAAAAAHSAPLSISTPSPLDHNETAPCPRRTRAPRSPSAPPSSPGILCRQAAGRRFLQSPCISRAVILRRPSSRDPVPCSSV
jgi:hypothetical protein